MAASPADVGILLTGVGKRYALVSVFAQHAPTIAADPNPLAPAQYAAHHRRAVPRFDDPPTSRRSRSCARSSVWVRWCRSPDLDLEILGHARQDGALPAFVPDGEIARATFDKYETHLLLERLGLPSPPTVLPGEPVDRYPVMVKPRWARGRARSTWPTTSARPTSWPSTSASRR